MDYGKGFQYCKFGRFPSKGIYFCVPVPQWKFWRLYKATTVDVDTGEKATPDAELDHDAQFPFVARYFKEVFGVDISGLGKRCLPRGRVLGPEETGGQWVILHGNDTPERMRHQIRAEFGLDGMKDVVWRGEEMEAMDSDEKRKLIEKCLLMAGLYKL